MRVHIGRGRLGRVLLITAAGVYGFALAGGAAAQENPAPAAAQAGAPARAADPVQAKLEALEGEVAALQAQISSL